MPVLLLLTAINVNIFVIIFLVRSIVFKHLTHLDVQMLAEAITVVMESSKKVDLAASHHMIQQTTSRFKRWGRKQPFLRYGLPFISLTVVGTLGMAHLSHGGQEATIH